MLGVAKSTPSSHSYGVGVASAWRDVTEMLSELVCSLSLGGGCRQFPARRSLTGSGRLMELGRSAGTLRPALRGRGSSAKAPPDSTAEQFSEGMELLMRCWTENQPFDFKGRFYGFEAVDVFPEADAEGVRPTWARSALLDATGCQVGLEFAAGAVRGHHPIRRPEQRGDGLSRDL